MDDRIVKALSEEVSSIKEADKALRQRTFELRDLARKYGYSIDLINNKVIKNDRGEN